jgi:hypothetical protein
MCQINRPPKRTLADGGPVLRSLLRLPDELGNSLVGSHFCAGLSSVRAAAERVAEVDATFAGQSCLGDPLSKFLGAHILSMHQAFSPMFLGRLAL